MKKFMLAAAAATLMTAPALAQDKNDASQYAPRIGTELAKVEGDTITGVVVDINRAGYLVIHNEGAGAPPASIGHIRVEPGKDIAVNVEFQGELGANPSLMLHYETNDNTTYDFGPNSTDVDTPVMIGDQVVAVPLKAM